MYVRVHKFCGQEMGGGGGGGGVRGFCGKSGYTHRHLYICCLSSLVLNPYKKKMHIYIIIKKQQ